MDNWLTLFLYEKMLKHIKHKNLITTRVMGRIAQSLGVDTRSPNGGDHWWDTHRKREKRNKRRHTANFISTSSFPQKSPQEYFFIDAVRI